MPVSSTIVAALRFDDGVLIGADSQVSDLIGKVRWPGEKLARINQTTLVAGFSGQSALINDIQSALAGRFTRPTAFDRVSRVRKGFEDSLRPTYTTLSEKYPAADWNSIWNVAPTGLAICWAEGAPRIFEIEVNGIVDSHENFRAVGSGTNSAYAAWNALGGQQLSGLAEGVALQLMARILQVSIDTDLAGVANPISIWVVTENKARQVQNSEMDSIRQVGTHNFLFSLVNLHTLASRDEFSSTDS